MTTYSLSELVEATTDVVADRIALVTEQRADNWGRSPHRNSSPSAPVRTHPRCNWG
jgi:hypothetical protein